MSRSKAHRTGRPSAALRRLAGGFAALALLGGCIAADPMPSPQRPDGDRIVVSATTAQRLSGPVDLVGIVGLDGAAQGVGFVEIRQPSAEWIIVARTSALGNFAAVVPGAAGDELRLTFRELPDGPASAELKLTVVRYDDTNDGTPQTPEGLTAGQVPEGSWVRADPPSGGMVQVVAGGLEAGLVAAIGNARTGEVVEATVDAEGGLTASVGATSGDTLVVIFRSTDSALTSEVVSLSVPAP